MPEIQASVGSGGVNQHEDTKTIQILLNTAPTNEGGPAPPIDIDGWCGQQTSQAIVAFQRAQRLPVQDGRVDPGKNTLRRLNELAASPQARFVPLPDLDPARLAQQSVMEATLWATAGLQAVAAAQQRVAKGESIDGGDSVHRLAFLNHFRLNDELGRARLESLLAIIQQNFSRAIGTLTQSTAVFHSVTRKEMSRDFAGRPGAPGYVMPGSRTRINWSPLFHVWTGGTARPGLEWTGRGFGSKCRAAMVLHEPIHLVDSQGGLDIYEHGAEYLTMSPDQAAHNAASYPSFGAHVLERSPEPFGPRYGAGRPEV